MFTLFLLMAEMRGKLCVISREANEINEALQATRDSSLPLQRHRGCGEGHYAFQGLHH